MGDDRKKSWREIDQQREKGGSGGKRRRDDLEFARERASKSQAYRSYKSNLDKLFSGGGAQLPEHMRERLGPASEEAQHQGQLLDALKKSPGADSLRAYLDAELELPEDPRLLMSLLDIRDEALLVPVLKRLLDLVEGGKKPNRMLLIQRLQAVDNFADDDEVKELAAMIRAAVD